ncbi:MAG TPA: hypothetical protein VK463_02280 [Desulfomonilaceae bacterium]|nr:hypothetical protein [Desulfomonilaceae bacterium]
MNRTRLILMLASTLALSFIAAQSLPAEHLWQPITAGCQAQAAPWLFAAEEGGGEVDLNTCQWECRMRYGLEPTGPGGGQGLEGSDEAYRTMAGPENYSLYTACVTDCNRKFWREFDKRTGR